MRKCINFVSLVSGHARPPDHRSLQEHLPAGGFGPVCVPVPGGGHSSWSECRFSFLSDVMLLTCWSSAHLDVLFGSFSVAWLNVFRTVSPAISSAGRLTLACTNTSGTSTETSPRWTSRRWQTRASDMFGFCTESWCLISYFLCNFSLSLSLRLVITSSAVWPHTVCCSSCYKSKTVTTATSCWTAKAISSTSVSRVKPN